MTAAQSAGPLVGGLLVRTLTAPVAILVDAMSYAVSAALLATLRVEEPHLSAARSATSGGSSGRGRAGSTATGCSGRTPCRCT